MRKLSPALISAAVAAALLSTAAVAQSTRIQMGSAVGTNGSTVTTSTTSPGNATTGTSGFGGLRSTEGALDMRGRTMQSGGSQPAPTSTGPAFNSSEDRPSNDTESAAANTGVNATAGFATNPNSTNAAPVGAALGFSPGQTSAGTAGATSAGLGVTGPTATFGTFESSNGTTIAGSNVFQGNLQGNVVPGATFAATTGFTGGMGDASGLNANGERVGNGGADFRAGAAVTAPTPTPLFNQAAQRGAAREAARRARGEEPRIIGLAPRTDRDLTHEMPDDPIIRY